MGKTRGKRIEMMFHAMNIDIKLEIVLDMVCYTKACFVALCISFRKHFSQDYNINDVTA